MRSLVEMLSGRPTVSLVIHRSQLLWRVSSADNWILDKAHDSAAPCRRTDKRDVGIYNNNNNNNGNKRHSPGPRHLDSPRPDPYGKPLPGVGKQIHTLLLLLANIAKKHGFYFQEGFIESKI